MADRNGRMPAEAGRPKHAESTQLARLTAADFATRFQEAWSTLWYVATAVLGNRSGADDVLQEAAIVGLKKLSQFDPETNFAAWMAKIVRFTALNHSRRRLHQPLDQDLVANDPGPQSGGRTQPILNGRGQLFDGQGDFDDAVAAALGHIDEDARACLLLRTLMEMPYRDIALALDMPEGTAMSHVHRARAALRQRLTRALPLNTQDSHD